jgi:Amt family ammonium transporter
MHNFKYNEFILTGNHGWLKNLGVLDFAGSAPIHLIGGVGAFISAWFIGPRIGRYDRGTKPLAPGNPFNVCLGYLILAFGWYGFNAGSGYGLSMGKWQLSARAGVNTIISSMAAAIFSVYFSMFRNKGKVSVLEVVSGMLCALAAINSGCFVFSPFVALLVGVIAAFLCLIIGPVIDKMFVNSII